MEDFAEKALLWDDLPAGGRFYDIIGGNDVVPAVLHAAGGGEAPL